AQEGLEAVEHLELHGREQLVAGAEIAVQRAGGQADALCQAVHAERREALLEDERQRGLLQLVQADLSAALRWHAARHGRSRALRVNTVYRFVNTIYGQARRRWGWTEARR